MESLLPGKNKKRYLIIFAAYLVFNLMFLMRTYAPANNSDDMSIFFGAARLAGLDWSGVSSAYHGQAYYIIFTPLFMLTEDTLLRHLIISVFNMFVLSGTGIIIYHIAIRFFKLESNIFTAVLPLIIITLTSQISTNVRNEVPIFAVVWVVCLILVCLCGTGDDDKKKRRALSVCLVLALCYGMLIHTRLQGFIAAIAAAILIYLIIYRKWLVSPAVFIPSMAIGYAGADQIRAFILRELWDGRAATEVSNASLKLITDVSRIPGPRAIIDIILNNIYAITVRTYGLAAVAVVLAVFIFIKFCISLKRRRLCGFCDDIGMPGGHFFILMVFGISMIGTILGLCTFYGRAISGIIGSGEINERIRGLQYTRYYSAYFGPVLLVMYTYFAKRRKEGALFCVLGIGVFAALLFYVRFAIHPYAGVRLLVDWFFLPESYMATGFIIAAMLGLYAVCLYKERGGHYMMFMFVILLALRVESMSMPFFNVQPRGIEGQVYAALSEARKEAPLPYEIYTTYEGMRFQYYFSHNHVTVGVPSPAGYEGIFICTAKQAESYEHFKDYDFEVFMIGDLAVWVRDEALQEALWKQDIR